MKTRSWPWLMLPVLPLLAGCPSGGGGDGVFEGTGVAPAVVYTANSGSNTVSGFTVGAGGSLLPTTPATVTTNNAEWLTVSPNGQFLYVSNQGSATVSGFSVNPATGALTPTTPTTFPTGVGSSPRGITVTPNGLFVYVANSTTNTVAGFPSGPVGSLARRFSQRFQPEGLLLEGSWCRQMDSFCMWQMPELMMFQALLLELVGH